MTHYHFKVTKKWLSRLREITARHAAQGTYTVLKHAAIASGAKSANSVEEALLARLATRRSWRRLDDRTFSFKLRSVEVAITVDHPFNATRFFLDITAAEIRVACARAQGDEMEQLQQAGRDELRRLFARDGIPWSEVS